jgi:hypothetical protein
MIVGRKISNSTVDKKRILHDIDAIKKMYGIEKHYLETLLRL